MVLMRNVIAVVATLALFYIVFFPNPIKSMIFGGKAGVNGNGTTNGNGATNGNGNTPIVQSITVGEGAGGTISCEGKPINIISAVYAKSSKFPQDGACPGIDVKDKMVTAVGQSDTYTFPGYLNGIFGDPCPGVHKEVSVQYSCGV